MSGATVTVEFSAHITARLKRLAKIDGVDIGEVVRRAAEAALPPVGKPRPRRPANDRGRVDTLIPKVKRLHAAGFTDAQMTEALGCSVWTVTQKRKALGLQSNALRTTTHTTTKGSTR